MDLKNGKLLQAAEDDGFEVLVTGDQTLHHEQNLTGLAGNCGAVLRRMAHPQELLAADHCRHRQRRPRFFSGGRVRHIHQEDDRPITNFDRFQMGKF